MIKATMTSIIIIIKMMTILSIIIIIIIIIRTIATIILINDRKRNHTHPCSRIQKTNPRLFSSQQLPNKVAMFFL